MRFHGIVKKNRKIPACPLREDRSSALVHKLVSAHQLPTPQPRVLALPQVERGNIA